jgi:hypothetical protein
LKDIVRWHLCRDALRRFSSWPSLTLTCTLACASPRRFTSEASVNNQQAFTSLDVSLVDEYGNVIVQLEKFTVTTNAMLPSILSEFDSAYYRIASNSRALWTLYDTPNPRLRITYNSFKKYSTQVKVIAWVDDVRLFGELAEPFMLSSWNASAVGIEEVSDLCAPAI